MEKSNVGRIVALCVFIMVISLIFAGRLYNLQIVNGEGYRQKSEQSLLNPTVVKASRGEMFDRFGRAMVTNRMGFSIRFDYTAFDRENQGTIILNLVKMCNQYDQQYFDSLPISFEQPFAYIENEDGTIRDQVKLENYLKPRKLTIEQDPAVLLGQLKDKYKLEGFTDQELRLVLGVIYEMWQRDFAKTIPYTFATDISIELVTQVEERHREMSGVSIAIDPIREYKTQSAAHVLGRIGVIYKEEYAPLKEKGYKMTDIVGKDGLERVLEDYLRGEDGINSIETDVSGQITQVYGTKEPKPGNNAILTLDLNLQEVAERSLAETIERLRVEGAANPRYGGHDAKAGSVVVLNVKNNDVLVMASAPTYNLETYTQDYNNIVANKASPLVNRSISGLYEPGSTFKMVTSVAALEEGIITPTETIQDKGKFTKYTSYQPECGVYRTNGTTHGHVNVSDALKVSCNYFYYDVGDKLGIDNIDRYARMFGLGEYTGIELENEKKGTRSNKETKAALHDQAWFPGDTLQVAIGQLDNRFTPLQLACYTSALANKGTLYKPHLLKSVRSFDNQQIIFTTQPEVVSRIDMSDSTMNAVLAGMADVTSDGTAANVFRDYPIKVAGKTGSAQVTGGSANAVFVAFAPYENPEIAIAIVVEHGGQGNRIAPIARDIFDAYFDAQRQTLKVRPTGELLP